MRTALNPVAFCAAALVFAQAAQAQSVPPPRHVEGGILSNHIYSLPMPDHNILVTPQANSAKRWTAPSGYEVVGSLGNEKSGFQGAIYRNVTTDKYTVVYRGTTYENLRDTATNADVVSQRGPDLERQLGDARRLTDHAISQYGKDNVTIAGHSLGGGIAQVESARTGLRAETYNAPGMADYIRDKYPDARVERISNNNRAGDAVSGSGTQPGYRREFEGTFPQSSYQQAFVGPTGTVVYGGGGSEAYLDHRMKLFSSQLARGATPIDAPTFQPLNGKATSVDQSGDGGATVRRMEFEGIARQNADEARAKAATAAANATLLADPPAAGSSFADVLLASMQAAQGAQAPAPSPGRPAGAPLVSPLAGSFPLAPTTPAIPPPPPPPRQDPGHGEGSGKGGTPAAKSCPTKAFKTKDGCHPGHNEKAHPGGCFCG